MKVTKWDGKPITKAGWYSGIELERYHGPNICDGPAVSSSDLRVFWSRSAAHMHAFWAENPKREERTVTNAMLLGGCTHFLLLGEDNFRTKYIAQPEEYPDKKTAELKKWNNNADYCKNWYAVHEAKGFTVVTIKMLEAIKEMAKTLRTAALVKEGLLRGHVETSGFFRDPETGIWIKVRPDVIPTDGPDFVDLKTASEVTTPALQKSIRTYGYQQQGALIGEACEALGTEFESFMCLFVETSAPYCARMVPLDDIDLGLGREQNRDCLRKIRTCIDLDHWPMPGEGDGLRPLPMAHAERERITERLKQEGV